MTQPPDELERRLRDVLRDRGLGVPAAADAIDRVHAGARRRQQRRTVISVTAAFVVVAAVGVGIGVGNTDRNSRPRLSAGPIGTLSALPAVVPSAGTASSGPPSSAVPEQSALGSRPPSSQPPSSEPRSSEPPSSEPPSSVAPSVTPPAAVPTAYPSAGSAVPTTFSPLSVTAVNDNTFWVLGTQRCGSLSCTAIIETTDAGSHFTEIAAPHASTTSVDSNTRVVTNVRFADNENGWAYGEALWTTSDGGATWTDTSLPAGSVTDLGAARAPGAVSGTVWAVVRPVPDTSGYELWRASYASGSGTGSWQRVDLGADPPAGDQPSLVVQGGSAYLLAADAKNVTHLYVATAGVSTAMEAAPCSAVESNMSAGIGSLWVACAAANADGNPRVAVSTDGGATWRFTTVSSPTALGVIGGVDAKTAVLDSGSGFTKVSTDGTASSVPIAAARNGFAFIGFTDAKTGFALSQPDPEQLWRTTDGGQLWNVVHFSN